MSKSLKVYCNTCNGTTNHVVLHTEEREERDDNEGYYSQSTWEIIRCLGCDDTSFRHSYWFSEDYDPETGRAIDHITLYPSRSNETIEIKPFYNVPRVVRSIYNETLEAYNNNLRILSAAGLRAIIEAICSHEEITGGMVAQTVKGVTKLVRKSNLEGKINGLNEKGIITLKQAAILHEHRYLGNEALHEHDAPSKETLRIAIEIIELVLDSLYEIDQKAGQLTFTRQRKKKST